MGTLFTCTATLLPMLQLLFPNMHNFTGVRRREGCNKAISFSIKTCTLVNYLRSAFECIGRLFLLGHWILPRESDTFGST